MVSHRKFFYVSGKNLLDEFDLMNSRYYDLADMIINYFRKKAIDKKDNPAGKANNRSIEFIKI